MSLFELDTAPRRVKRAPVPLSDIDVALTAQIIVAWAGESGEERRMGWWRSDLVSEYGGEDLFRRLLPSSWSWAVLQGTRETARRKDADIRKQGHDPDRIVSLFSLGFELDERIEERLQDLKRIGQKPNEALPGLAVIGEGWSRTRFIEWVDGHGNVETTATPVGRRLKGGPPDDLDHLVRKLIGGLAPIADAYPLPHFRRTP